MNILFIEPCYKNFGGYYRAINFRKALAKKGHNIDLVCPSNISFCLKISTSHPVVNLRVIELPRINLGFLFQLRILRGFITTIIGLTNNYQIVHSEAPVQPESIIPAVLLKLFKKPIVIDWDDMYQHGIFSENFLVNAYINFIELNFTKIFKYITVNSQYMQKLAYKRGAKNVLLLINAIDTNQFSYIDKSKARHKLNLSTKKHYIISIGHTYEKGRLNQLIKIFHAINKIDKNTYLLINSDIQNRIKINKNLSKYIINLGYIPENLLNYYLSASDCAIFTFGNHVTEKSCYPIRTSGYISALLPIIINDNDNQVVKTLSKFNCIITGKNPKRIATKYKQFIKSKSTQKMFRKNLIIAKKQLSWDKIVIPTLNLYHMAINHE